mmetsp:Transcript_12203/g.33469  ORF Transcript_12203/g.33469 Transcript_12203/m.33469 type:complete len:155 (-) Transcript_12203:417-881(-)
MYAMSVAGAWQLDSALRWPPWLRLRCQQLGLGSHPIVAMLLVIALAGACFAAAKPITEYTLILMNPRTRDEIRLRESRGFTRPPSRRPGESTPWQEVVPILLSSYGFLRSCALRACSFGRNCGVLDMVEQVPTLPFLAPCRSLQEASSSCLAIS